MDGSRSSGSSGPSPNTSSSSSTKSVSRSPRLSGVPSSASSSPSSVRISLSARARSDCASASRFRRLSSFRCTPAFSSRYCWRGGCGRRLGDGSDGAGATLFMDGYQTEAMPAVRRSRPGSLRRAGCGAGSDGAGLENLPREVIELRRDVGVAGQRERHARVERGRHGLVVARERVVNRVAERAFDLLRRNRIRLLRRG